MKCEFFRCVLLTGSDVPVEDCNNQAYLSPALLCELSHGIASMSAGHNHMALVTTRGEIMTVGRNPEGQLGLGHRKDAVRSALVPCFSSSIDPSQIH